MNSEKTNRFPRHRPGQFDKKSLARTWQNFISHGTSPEAAGNRLRGPARERLMEHPRGASAPTLMLIGVILAVLVNPWFYPVSGPLNRVQMENPNGQENGILKKYSITGIHLWNPLLISKNQTSKERSAAMKLSSPAFKAGGKIPSKYTCDGDNINPPLNISDVPSGTKSLALIMEDPDVPKHLRPDGMWDHWIVFNIPPKTREIPEAQEPPGTHGKGTSGNKDYFGPCPPDREHRYFFKLFALDSTLDLNEKARKSDLEKAMEGHILEKAELMGRYERTR